MLRKIISGGQTGADQAALDVAMDFGMTYGGWVPKGRKTENGKLPEKYANVQESSSYRYADRTIKNVVESDGTLILSNGPLTGGSKLTASIAEQYGRPFLHVDLSESSRFNAAHTIYNWIIDKQVGVLNVAGPRASSDPGIYQVVYDVLYAVFFLNLASWDAPDGFIRVTPKDPESPYSTGPILIEEAVDILMEALTQREIAFLTRADLREVHPVLQRLIPVMEKHRMLLKDNPILAEECRKAMAGKELRQEELPWVLLKFLSEKVKKLYQLRIVK